MLARSLIAALALLVAAPGVAPAPASAQDAAKVKAGDARFSSAELDQLLAPIALYPDELLSNVLMAATYPLEVVQAARWIAEPENAKLKGEALTKALEDKDWDPSVKALTQFPDVLAMMSEQLEWTQKLGDAFVASQADVMDRVQFLREKADQAGNLKSNEHQTVTAKSEGGKEYIYIEPAEPEVVYVPVYEPDVYGSWWYPDYPPYYWEPEDVAFVDDFFWLGGVAIVPSLWHWSRPRWHRHYIHVSPRKFNRLHKHKRKLRSQRWRHDAHHRRGVRNKDAKLWRKRFKPDGEHRLLSRRKGGPKAVESRRRESVRARLGKPSRTLVSPSKKPDFVSIGKKRRASAARLSGRKKLRATSAKKRSSAAIKKGSRRKAFSMSRKRSSVRKFSRGRSAVKVRRGGRKAGARRGGHRGGRRGGRGRRR